MLASDGAIAGKVVTLAVEGVSASMDKLGNSSVKRTEATKDAFDAAVEWSQSRPRFSEKGATQLLTGVYRMPVLSVKFCEQLVAELQASTTQAQRLASGIDQTLKLMRFGDAVARALEPLLPALRRDAASLRERKAYADSAALAPWLAARSQLRFVEAIVIHYDSESNKAIELHTDDMNLTMNVNIGGTFSGGHLVFQCKAAGEGKQSESPYLLDVLNDHSPDCKHRTPHLFEQLPGLGFLHLSVVPHMTKPLTQGQRVNLVLKFALVDADEDAASRQLKRWPELFNVLQRRVLSFLDARGLCYIGQTSKGMATLAAEPTLWRGAYCRNAKLAAFVSEQDLLTGAHLDKQLDNRYKEVDLPSATFNLFWNSTRRQVKLVGDDWRGAFKACKEAEQVGRLARLEFERQQEQEARQQRLRMNRRRATGVYFSPQMRAQMLQNRLDAVASGAAEPITLPALGLTVPAPGADPGAGVAGAGAGAAGAGARRSRSPSPAARRS